MKRTNKKYIATAASVVVAFSVAAPMTYAAKFSDTAGNSHERAIDALSTQGIIAGYPDGTFKPNRTLTRSDVVKLLGRYLVTQGYTIPSDYKTTMRFTDLTASSQDELLQYAAVVKDANVFRGNNGALMPNDNITRENMAVVLVRAYSEIKKFDFVSHVQNQSFTKDVLDYSRAKAEARAAIEVFDYYDITGVAQFNPKNNTTRGQFAGFLYKWMGVNVPGQSTALTVKSATVTNATTVRVVLSDNTTHTVTLPTALEENVEKAVTFTINNQSYTAKVTYAVEELKVARVTAVNGGQVAITFNQQVKLNETVTSSDLAEIVSVVGVDQVGAVQLTGGTVSADGRTLTVNVANTTLGGRYVVKVNDVMTVNNVKLIPYDQVVRFAKDMVAPTIVSTTNTDAKTVSVMFSEPMQAYANAAMQFRVANGTAVTGITGSLAAGATAVMFDLTNAKVNGQALKPNETVMATFTAARDASGNMLSPNPATISFAISAADGVKPTVKYVAQTGPRTFKLTFSERILDPQPADFYVALGNTLQTITSVTQDTNDKSSYHVTTENVLNGQYTIGTATNKFITDISGETNSFVTSQTFTQDAQAPKVESYQVMTEGNIQYVKVVFDKEVDLASTSKVKAVGSYTLNGYTTAVNGEATALAYAATNKKEVRIKLADLLDGKDLANARYMLTLQFTNVLSTFAINAEQVAITFVRESDTNENTALLATPAVATSVNDTTLANSTIKLVFATAVDGVSATNKDNYTVQGAVVKEAVVTSEDKKTVWLTLESSSNTFTGKRDVTITNVKAENSTVITPQLKVEADLKENIQPTVTVAKDSAQTVKLTFSEAVQGVMANSFTVEVNGQVVAVSAVTTASDNKTAILTLDTTIANSNVVKVKAGASFMNVKDDAGNSLQFDEQQFTY